MENTNWALVKFDEIKYIAQSYETFEFSHLPIKQSSYQALTINFLVEREVYGFQCLTRGIRKPFPNPWFYCHLHPCLKTPLFF